MSTNSISVWISQLRTGDQQAAERLWDAYFRRLVIAARTKLNGRFGLVADEEDIALSAFKSFCRGLTQGRYPEVSDRDELWKLLITITLHKALHVVRDGSRKKRGGDWKRLMDDADANDAGLLEQLVSSEPLPEVAAQVNEEVERLFRVLGDPELEALAVLKMEGFTNQEIAQRWQRAERTVERKLNLIRKIWDSQEGAN